MELIEREQKVREWEDAQREAAKNHGFYGVAQIEEHSYSWGLMANIDSKNKYLIFLF